MKNNKKIVEILRGRDFLARDGNRAAGESEINGVLKSYIKCRQCPEPCPYVEKFRIKGLEEENINFYHSAELIEKYAPGGACRKNVKANDGLENESYPVIDNKYPPIEMI